MAFQPVALSASFVVCRSASRALAGFPPNLAKACWNRFTLVLLRFRWNRHSRPTWLMHGFATDCRWCLFVAWHWVGDVMMKHRGNIGFRQMVPRTKVAILIELIFGFRFLIHVSLSKWPYFKKNCWHAVVFVRFFQCRQRVNLKPWSGNQNCFLHRFIDVLT